MSEQLKPAPSGPEKEIYMLFIYKIYDMVSMQVKLSTLSPFGSIDSHDNMLPKCINDRLCNSFVNDAIVLQTPWSGFGVKFFNH